MAEIREIVDLAHELEFLYEGLGEGRLRASPTLFTLLQAATTAWPRCSMPCVVAAPSRRAMP